MGSLKRRLLSALLCALLLPIQVTAYAAETGFSDVFPGSWYAEAVQYAVENGLMNGTGGGEFSPNTGLNYVWSWKDYNGQYYLNASAYAQNKANAALAYCYSP